MMPETVRVAPAKADRVAGKALAGTIKEHRKIGQIHQLTITLQATPEQPFVVAELARVWLKPAE